MSCVSGISASVTVQQRRTWRERRRLRPNTLICVRTTINLPDGLAEAAKAKALAEGRTFTSVVEEGLRRALEVEPAADDIPRLASYGDPNGRFLIDPLDREARWNALDDDGPR